MEDEWVEDEWAMCKKIPDNKQELEGEGDTNACNMCWTRSNWHLPCLPTNILMFTAPNGLWVTETSCSQNGTAACYRVEE